MMVHLIVGLGNPGLKYAFTRHNIGFLVVDGLIQHFHAQAVSDKFKSKLAQATFEGHTLLFCKPQTYMNLSGEAIAPLYRFYKCMPEQLIVIHDELDLDLGVLRIKKRGSHGGHNGLLSLHQHLGKEHQTYYRIRMGIGHPRRLNLPQSAADFVLSRIGRAEQDILLKQTAAVCDIVTQILQGKVAQAMVQYHSKQ